MVIGSGIAAQRLSPGNTGLQLFENAAATAAGLFAIILMFGPVSGGHFNPVVSFVDAAFGGLRWRDAAAYLPVQVAGCVVGAVVANVMFSLAAIELSTKHRASPAHFLSEVVATLGLLLVIFALARSGRSRSAPAAVGAYIGAAYFFTSSTSFANPAITIGRMFSNTFAGIAPSSVPSFRGRPGGGWPGGPRDDSGPLSRALARGGGRHPRPPCRPDRASRRDFPHDGEASRRCCSCASTMPVGRRWQLHYSPATAAHESSSISAGSGPGETLNPAVVAAMAEVGIDITAQRPKKLTDDMARRCRCDRDHGVRRCLPRLSRQAVCRLGSFPTQRASRSKRCGPSGTTSTLG